MKGMDAQSRRSYADAVHAAWLSPPSSCHCNNAMPKDKSHGGYDEATMGGLEGEARSLLSGLPNDDDDDHSYPLTPLTSGRQSSLSLQSPNHTPHTPRSANRVHFDLEERVINEGAHNGNSLASNDEAGTHMEVGGLGEEEEEEEEDPFDRSLIGRRSSTGQRAPLLTDVEAPSVTVASSDLEFNAEDLLEGARSKSGMRSAFMNMANSIM